MPFSLFSLWAVKNKQRFTDTCWLLLFSVVSLGFVDITVTIKNHSTVITEVVLYLDK